MKAAWYTETGPARKVLHVGEVPEPDPQAGEVKVKVSYSAVNPSDWQARSGWREPPVDGQIPHQDGSGVVVAVGDDVSEARIGERVWVYHAAFGRRLGTAAEFTCIPQEQAVRLPDSVPLLTGALIGIPLITAYQAVRSIGVTGGGTVLVTGGGGAVGSAAIKWAKLAGAHVVATASTPQKQAFAAEAGADIVLDYRSNDFHTHLATAAQGSVSLVVDVALGANLPNYIGQLARGARVVAYAMQEADPTLPLAQLIRRSVTLEFLLVYNLAPADLDAATKAITASLQAESLVFPPAEVFGLDEIALAHEAVEHGVLGRVVVAVAGEPDSVGAGIGNGASK